MNVTLRAGGAGSRKTPSESLRTVASGDVDLGRCSVSVLAGAFSMVAASSTAAAPNPSAMHPRTANVKLVLCKLYGPLGSR